MQLQCNQANCYDPERDSNHASRGSCQVAASRYVRLQQAFRYLLCAYTNLSPCQILHLKYSTEHRSVVMTSRFEFWKAQV
jgi:hypothetical protein